MKKRVAILGGGISGMAAAWYLQNLAPNIETHLIEAQSRLGGVIQTQSSEIGLVELGADNFATLVPDALRLCKDMGIERELIAPNQENRLARIVHRGQLYPIPAGFSLMQPTRIDAILASKILSWPGKIRLLSEYWVKRRASDDDESLQAFATRRLGREAYERLVEPIVGGIFTANGDTLSMQAALPQFVEMEAKYGGLMRAHFAKRNSISKSDQASRKASGARYDQFMAPQHGMQWWLDRIQNQLASGGVQIHIEFAVEGICLQPNQTWKVESQNSKSLEFDGIVVALNSAPAAGILRDDCPTIANQLEKVPYASSVVAALVYHRDEIPRKLLCFGLIVPRIENRSCLAISFSSEKYPNRVSPDQILLRVFMGGAVNPSAVGRSDEESLAIAKQEVRSLLNVQSEPVWQQIVRWPNSMPQYLLGHRQRLSIIHNSLNDFPTLRLAGNAYEGVGIPQCIRSGRAAAEYFTQLWKS